VGAIKRLIAIGSGAPIKTTALKDIAMLTHRKVVRDIAVILCGVGEMGVSNGCPSTSALQVLNGGNGRSFIMNLDSDLSGLCGCR
jgi:hypothetical protein